MLLNRVGFIDGENIVVKGDVNIWVEIGRASCRERVLRLV